MSDETREMVKKKMRETNFSPKIVRSVSDTIAVFISHSITNPITNSFIFTIISGISNVVFDREYIFTIIPFSKIPPKRDEYKRFCMRHQIGGAIFISPGTYAEFVKDFAGIIPTSVVGTYFDEDNLICIGADNFNGAYEMTNHLISMGHKDIIFSVADMGFQDHKARFEGYKKALQDNGIVYNSKLLLEYDYTNYSTIDLTIMLQRILSDEFVKPTTIFCSNDQEVYRISSILKTLGFSIPNDISIAGFDDYDASKHFTPPLTTVKQPLVEEGKIAAEVVCDALQTGNSINGRHIILPTKLMVRQSVNRLERQSNL